MLVSGGGGGVRLLSVAKGGLLRWYTPRILTNGANVLGAYLAAIAPRPKVCVGAHLYYLMITRDKFMTKWRKRARREQLVRISLLCHAVFPYWQISLEHRSLAWMIIIGRMHIQSAWIFSILRHDRSAKEVVIRPRGKKQSQSRRRCRSDIFQHPDVWGFQPGHPQSLVAGRRRRRRGRRVGRKKRD